MKPGMKTTEFWQTVFANLVALLVSTGLLTPEVADQWAGILGPVLMAVVTAVYSYTRMRAKVAGSGAELETLRALTDRFDTVARPRPLRDKGWPPVPPGEKTPLAPEPVPVDVDVHATGIQKVLRTLERLERSISADVEARVGAVPSGKPPTT